MSAAPRPLAGLPVPALVVGVLALVALVVGGFFTPVQFFRSYLIGFLFWTGIAVGCLGALMMQHLTGGRWGVIARRPFESASLTLPLLLLLSIPILFGVEWIYVWSHLDIVAGDEHLLHKSVYLNTGFFVARTIGYLVLWSAAAYLLARWSREQDRTGDPKFANRMQRLSGPGLFLLAITVSLALVDWVMSIEPLWYSTIYALVYMAGDMLSAFALVVVVLAWTTTAPPLDEATKPQDFHRLGNLMLAFVMLWAYTAFSQYLLIYSGDLREETPWYLRRTEGGWGWIALGLICFHFFLPFFLLLSRRLKRDRRWLAAVAVLVLVLRFVDTLWLVEPAFHPASLWVSWMDFAAPIGIGGIWLALFARLLVSRPPLPLADPYTEMGHER